MPNLDGGHYFLTALFPVLTAPVARDDGTITSPSHALREALASMPTAAQSEACIISNRRSPFGRCRQTHFARLVVLDQPAFNGRNPANAIGQSLRKKDLLAHEPVDCLATPWLLVILDFDPTEHGDGDSLNAYAHNLWGLMEAELRTVFRHCHDFAHVASGDDFAAYLAAGQVETTMPFNDYWTLPPPFPSLELPAVGVIGIVSLLAVLIVEWAVQRALGPVGGWLWAGIPVAIGLSLTLLLWIIRRRGSKAFPAAPGSDLVTILKALFLQQRFTAFAAAHQGADAHALYLQFGQFLRETEPENDQAPTREPGVIPQ